MHLANTMHRKNASWYLYPDLANNNISSVGVAALCKARWDKLENLSLRGNKIGNLGCKYLSKARFTNLGSLWLGRAKRIQTKIKLEARGSSTYQRLNGNKSTLFQYVYILTSSWQSSKRWRSEAIRGKLEQTIHAFFH